VNLIDELEGRWVGLGQHYRGSDKTLTDTIQMTVDLKHVNSKRLEGVETLEYLNDSSKNKSFKVAFEVISEDEFLFQPEWSADGMTYLYLNDPISFQGSFLTDMLGPKTKTLDNNFIVADDWQMNIEYESADGTDFMVAEYALEREDSSDDDA
jgi:hypothetical protein